MSRKITDEMIKDKLLSLNCIFISYDNNTKKIKFICNLHKENGIQETNWKNIKRNQSCHICGKERSRFSRKLSDEKLKKITEHAGFIFNGSEYINGKRYILYFCKHHIDKGIQKMLVGSMRKSHGYCPWCLNRKRTHDDFIKEMEGINPSVIILSNFSKTEDYIKCQCKICRNIWESKANNLLQGQGCKKCAAKKINDKRKYTDQEFKQKMNVLHPTINVLSKYISIKQKVKCVCKIDGYEWEVTPDSLLNGKTGCPICSSKVSHGENKIMNLLKKWDIDYEYQAKFEDCKNILPLPFDFHLINYNILIEYDGEGHYKEIPYSNDVNKNKEAYKKVKINDQLKTNYCLSHNIHLIRIPYWKYDDIENILFDEFIQQGVFEEISN